MRTAIVLFLGCVLCKLHTAWHQLEGYTYEMYLKEFQKSASLEGKQAFEANLEKIKIHNSKGLSYKMGLNQFTDVSPGQFKHMMTGYSQLTSLEYSRLHPERVSPAPLPRAEALQDLPTSVDWRQKQVVTAVKDQGACGSCWAFGSTETIESHVAIASGQLMVLAPQQLVSCSKNPNKCGGTGGCDGSVPELAFDYVKDNGMATEWTYSYTAGRTGQTGTCFFNSSTPAVISLTGFQKLQPNSYEAVMDALANKGPLAINVQANVWQSYESGVFTGCDDWSNVDIDHVVQLVGYGTDAQHGDYWTVRNSWNTVWGEAGYIRLQRNATPKCGSDPTPQDGTGCAGNTTAQHVCGQCAILFDVSYPTGATVKGF